ncbi:MAG: hypothetical protein NT062_28225, partial [Proteobacteria bacterium]|nr:hypothetical protein [Pseudomonadota bacterium]
MRGRTIAFSHDARHAVIAEGEHAHFVATSGGVAPVVAAVGAVQDVIACGNQFWLAAGGALHRFSATGAALVAPTPLHGSGTLTATALGSTSAAWSGSPISVFTGGDATPTEIPGAPEWVAPVSSARWVTYARDRVRLRDASSERWSVASPGARVLDGAVLFGARAVALVSPCGRDPRAHQLTILGLHDGALQQRISIASADAIRFAPTRGFAVILSSARSITLFDLRFGRVLKEHVTDRDLLDVVLDDAGQYVLLRYAEAHHDVQIISVRELMTAGAALQLAPLDLAGAATATVDEQAAPAEPVVPARDFHHVAPLGVLALLPPRPTLEPVRGEVAVSLLARYRDIVKALLGRAITRAWDEGRLTFPNEGPLPFFAEVRGLLGGQANRARADLEA